MSQITRLSVNSIRNIEHANLVLSPDVNLLHGENGSGKTSILEAVHLLAVGRSFRSSKVDPLIRDQDDEALVFAQLAGGHKIGLRKPRRRTHELKLDEDKQRNWERVAQLLPVQILDSNSFLLLEGGPKSRRRFLDWGVFHVEQRFVTNWRNARKCLANRNQLLKQPSLDSAQIAAWDSELCAAAELVNQARSDYFAKFIPVFEEVYGSLNQTIPSDLSVEYFRGWDEEKPLAQVLIETRGLDRKYSASQNGPHRADIRVKIGKHNAVEILSRGQQKILVSSLKIAQAVLLTQSLDRHCVFLADDLPAELDRENRLKILAKLASLGGQLFVTCVDLEGLGGFLPEGREVATFHVERGTITA